MCAVKISLLVSGKLLLSLNLLLLEVKAGKRPTEWRWWMQCLSVQAVWLFEFCQPSNSTWRAFNELCTRDTNALEAATYYVYFCLICSLFDQSIILSRRVQNPKDFYKKHDKIFLWPSEPIFRQKADEIIFSNYFLLNTVRDCIINILKFSFKIINILTINIWLSDLTVRLSQSRAAKCKDLGLYLFYFNNNPYFQRVTSSCQFDRNIWCDCFCIKPNNVPDWLKYSS